MPLPPIIDYLEPTPFVNDFSVKDNTARCDEKRMAYLKDKISSPASNISPTLKKEVRDKMWKLARIRKSLRFTQTICIAAVINGQNCIGAMWLRESKLHAKKKSALLALRNFDTPNEEKWKRVAV